MLLCCFLFDGAKKRSKQPNLKLEGERMGGVLSVLQKTEKAKHVGLWEGTHTKVSPVEAWEHAWGK